MKEKEKAGRTSSDFLCHNWYKYIKSCLHIAIGKSPETQELGMFVDVFVEDIRNIEGDVCLVVLGNNCRLKQKLTYYKPLG